MSFKISVLAVSEKFRSCKIPLDILPTMAETSKVDSIPELVRECICQSFLTIHSKMLEVLVIHIEARFK